MSAHLIGDNQIMALLDTEFLVMDNLQSSVKHHVLSKGNRTKSDSMGFASQGRGLKENIGCTCCNSCWFYKILQGSVQVLQYNQETVTLVV